MCVLTTALGCQSRRHKCVTCWECSDVPVQTVVVTVPAPEPVAQQAPVASEAEESEPIANVALNAVAPGMEGSDATGTIVFTPPEAKTLGIKPGVTPTALWVPSRANSEIIASQQ
jgi:hypothetical protein